MTTTDVKTKVSDLIEMGGGGLPIRGLKRAHERETKRNDLQADTKICESYKREQIAKLRRSDACESAVKPLAQPHHVSTSSSRRRWRK